ncbi:unnamed protein product [Jaminaea pallidilutea]
MLFSQSSAGTLSASRTSDLLNVRLAPFHHKARIVSYSFARQESVDGNGSHLALTCHRHPIQKAPRLKTGDNDKQRSTWWYRLLLGDFPRVAFFPQRSETRRGDAWEQRKDTRQRRRGKEKGSEGDKRRQGNIEDAAHRRGRHSNIVIAVMYPSCFDSTR